MKNVTSPGEMNIQCDSVAYGAIVIDGCVRYYREYSHNGRIVYTVYITEKQYNDYIGGKGHDIRHR